MKPILTFLTILCVHHVSAVETKPNILVILADDLGYGDVGFNGCKDIPTPHIDSIARNGVRCSSGYVSAPMCGPSRCGLLTGRYQQRFGYEVNNDDPGIGLPLTETTMAQRLKAAGYVTGAIGKWHLGMEAQFHPLSRGFDEFFGFLPGATNYLPGKKSILLRNREPAPHTEYLTKQFGGEAVSFIEKHRAQPWFLYLAFNAPHTPLEATQEYLARAAHIPEGKRRTYAAMVIALDDAVGRVLAKLRESGQEERTLITFLSDNGGQITIGAGAASNAPFSGEKGEVQEGGIRIPFAMQWKGTVPAGQVIETPVISLDLLPTFLASAGSTPQPEWALDGINLLPMLKGEAKPAPRNLYWRMNKPAGSPPHRWAIRSGDWKLFRDEVKSDKPIAQRDYLQRLVNLPADLTEQHDLTATEPQIHTRLQTEWQQWSSGLMEPFINQTSTAPAGSYSIGAMFARWDTNKDNQLTLEEYTQGSAIPAADAAKRFAEFAKGKTGQLTGTQFFKLIQATNKK